MLIVYRTPADPAAFDKHYFDVHTPLEMKLPGLSSYEVSRGPILSLAGDPIPYLIGIVHFDDLAAIRTAFASPVGQACAVDRQLMAPNDADFQMYLFDSSEACPSL